MSTMNSVIIVGNLGKDPEVRSFQSGDRVASFSVATSETWKDKNSGERKEKTQWHNVVIMNERTVAVAEQYLKKGDKVGIQGAIEYRKFTDKEGNERYMTEIVIGRFSGSLTLLGSKSGGGEASEPAARPAAPRAAAPARRPVPAGGGDLDDEIPFGKCWE